MKDKILFWVRHTGINAVYAGAGAALGYVAAHGADLTGLGLDPTTSTLVGGFIGTIASRIQAKVSPPPAAS